MGNPPLINLETHIYNNIYDPLKTIISTGERPFIEIWQDRRYWVIHVITIPSLFLAGVIFIDSPRILFGVPSFTMYFSNHNTLRQISLINDRFSSLNEISDI